MSDKERVDKALALIKSAGIKDELITPEQVYDSMGELTLMDLAEEISEFVKLIYNLREVLERV